MTAHHNGAARVTPHVIRVAVIDDTPLIRVALRTVIDGDDGLQLVGDGDDGDGVARAARPRGTDVVVIDPWGSGGVASLQQACALFPDARILVLSHALTAERVRACMDGLAHGCVDKSIAPADLPSLLRQVVAGLQVMPTLPGNGGHPLTAREIEVLRLAASGRTNTQIARALFVTEQTVKFHLSNIYRKLGTHNRTEAAHAARAQGLID